MTLDFMASSHNGALDPSWVNLDDIRLWIRTCDYEHGHECQTADTKTAVSWLIDVADQCLIPCDPNRHYQYVALSYVWGHCPSSQTTMANLDALQVPGVLSENNKNIVIPKTILHAMKLVNLLDIRFLWVDRFCICQDDARSMHLQLRQMGDIYENAYFTLIAANGEDANHGLHGIQGVTDQRNLKLTGSIFSTWLYWKNLEHEASKWYTRGWTFQELFFSHRKLKFQYKVALWECSCAIWHESTGVTCDLPVSANLPQRSPYGEGKPIRITPWRSYVDQRFAQDYLDQRPMTAYLRMVREYNGRILTDPADGMRAFAGVTGRMEAEFPGGFVWGIPVINFEAAFLWRNDGIMVQRNETHPCSRQLPSWSWVGWQGRITGSHWEHYGVRIVRNEEDALEVANDKTWAQLLVIPYCEWSCTTSEGTLPIVSNFRLCSQPDLYEAREKVHIASQHNAIHTLLKTRAKVVRCIFTAPYGSPRRAAIYSPTRYKYKYDLEPECIGFLSWSRVPSANVERQECELMLLSKTVTKLPRWGIPNGNWESASWENSPLFFYACPHFKYQAYNVLWITRRDGIAYREALGMVSVEAFDSLPSKMMDIILG
ncbi:heterokaryon incompatibility protein-domain-containing protein [Hypoxylon sp. FL1150]|nr:heterokaryon incompatibility protein-domain-containing protein [Hypoxylon sp. FL1150]